MATETRDTLSKKLADKHGLSTNESRQIVNLFFQVIQDTVIKEGKCRVANFCSFEVRNKKQRQGMDFKSKEKITIPSRNGLVSRFSNQSKNNVSES